MRVELIAFTARGNALAERLAAELTGAGCPAACTREGLRVEEWAARAFGRSEALVFVGAAGIAVRAIAPCLRHKSTDPAVVVVDEAGRYAVPILSGHLGGANDLARRIAALTGAEAVLTTATDVNGVFAADQWARRQGLLVPVAGGRALSRRTELGGAGPGGHRGGLDAATPGGPVAVPPDPTRGRRVQAGDLRGGRPNPV